MSQFAYEQSELRENFVRSALKSAGAIGKYRRGIAGDCGKRSLADICG